MNTSSRLLLVFPILVLLSGFAAATPLHDAVSEGDIDKVRMLLDRGANVNAIADGQPIADVRRYAPLHKAASKGQTEIVRVLLDKGANIEARDTRNRTPLVYAAVFSHTKTLQYLLERGADVNVKMDGVPLLSYATAGGNEGILRILLSRSADADISEAILYLKLVEASGDLNQSAAVRVKHGIAMLEKIAQDRKLSGQPFTPSRPQERETVSARPQVAAALASLPVPGNVKFGNYHALIVGNNAYKYLPRLDTAVKDAQVLADLLQKSYGFNVTLLINATRQQVIDVLDQMRLALTEQDNLLIYYAGHGWLDVEADRGFWLPVDAEENRRASWISNSDITDTVRATRAKHVLVVADSCYAGTLTRGISPRLDSPAVARLAQKRARTVLASGGLEPVADAGGGGHSVFARALLDALRGNEGVLDMSQIFSTVRHQVMLGAQQTPQYGDIRQAGHEGGDFLFVRQR